MARTLICSTLLLGAAAATSCSDSPAAPSAAPTFVARPAGAWRGSTAIVTCSADTPSTPVTADLCLAAGSFPITARLEQSGDTLAGDVTYQGVATVVSGRLNGRTVRLEGAAAAETGSPRVDIKEWRTAFDGPDEMSGSFTLVLTGSRDGVPTAASMTIQVTRLVRSGA
jgi:hypothetical protein